MPALFDWPYIPRELEAPLSAPGPAGRAEVIIGPRQVGKSTMLQKLVEGRRHIILTGEDEDDLAILSDPKSYLKLTEEYPYLIIDEAQFIPGIGRVIKRIVDNNRSGSRIFVTGSSSLDLAGGLKESAAGRFNSYELWPFSLRELARRTSWIEVKRSMNERLIYGSMPAVVNDPRHAEEYLLDISDAVLYKDIFKLAEMRRPTELTKLVKYLAYNIGSEVKYGTMASELGIQNKTIERYIDLLEACCILRVVPSLSRNPQSEIKLGKKIYFYDNGIRNALIRNFSPLPARTDSGALWENLFFTERLKLHAVRRDGTEIFFWRTRAQHEVDFLEVQNGKVAAFECKSSPKTKTTSIRAFERAYPDTPVTIATPGNVDELFD
ncbi:ATP-binding protein [Sutterella faecalis]|uniref:ATP-binding protein n=2 Tax=Sutterella TaxID=40544 RepID=A0AAI9SDF0_9BURK|nr:MULTISPECIES: ATP-binding protein [Sutterella]KAB7651887.1 ATP-binding protein [Sutterella seckii]QDA54194.1 ATP-binding protein [Sutterella faecalis]